TTTIRRDKDGYAIPEIPIDPSLISASNRAMSELGIGASSSAPSSSPSTILAKPSSKRPRTRSTPADPNPTPPPSNEPPRRPRGRPRKDGTIPPPPPSITTPTDIAIEEALESEISQYLNDPSTQEHAEAYSSSLASAQALSLARRPDAQIPDSSHISDSEFADDPEVENCVLSLDEQAIKERIWVHENRDYLREQQRKLLKAQMEERQGTARTKKRRNRKKRIGEGGEGSQASTPAEAVVNVMKRRGFSKKINYGAIRGMFEGRSSRLGSREPSVPASIFSSASSAPSVGPSEGDGDGEGGRRSSPPTPPLSTLHAVAATATRARTRSAATTATSITTSSKPNPSPGKGTGREKKREVVVIDGTERGNVGAEVAVDAGVDSAGDDNIDVEDDVEHLEELGEEEEEEDDVDFEGMMLRRPDTVYIDEDDEEEEEEAAAEEEGVDDLDAIFAGKV
ncbi:MAG: transcription factor TFIIIB subunit brf1, partial [Thelocarpon superellum]